MDEVLNYEGINDMCIAVDKSDLIQTSTSVSNYLAAFEGEPHYYDTLDQAEDSLVFYRRLLKWLPRDRKTILYTMGGYVSLYRLFDDQECKNLFTEKIDKVWCCGGYYPSGVEYNFSINWDFTNQFLKQCPVPLLLCGVEIMGQFEVGQSLGGGAYSWDNMQKALAFFHQSGNFDGIFSRFAGDSCVAVMVVNDDNALSNITLERGNVVVTNSFGNSTFTQSEKGKHLIAKIAAHYQSQWFDYYKSQINARLTRLYQGHYSGSGKRLPRV
jgi:hypothetical protein